MRRLGLQLVGRTMEASKLLPAKQAFRILDPDWKGYITEDDLVEVWETVKLTPFLFLLCVHFFFVRRCYKVKSETIFFFRSLS